MKLLGPGVIGRAKLIFSIQKKEKRKRKRKKKGKVKDQESTELNDLHTSICKVDRVCVFSSAPLGRIYAPFSYRCLAAGL